jgi:hypothetical protein
MVSRRALVILASGMLTVGFLPAPGGARAETVYEFVRQCRQQQLGDCFAVINARLGHLNEGRDRRICLPRAFGGIMLGRGVVPVSLLEHVRVKLSAARFGHAGAETDDVITDIIGALYPCSADRAGLQ